jgi:hypothetical protein
MGSDGASRLIISNDSAVYYIYLFVRVQFPKDFHLEDISIREYPQAVYAHFYYYRALSVL